MDLSAERLTEREKASVASQFAAIVKAGELTPKVKAIKIDAVRSRLRILRPNPSQDGADH